MSYKINKLQNGLRIVTSPLHETKAATVLVLVKAGSRNESQNINGISHFIEHMMFKGTEKRPTTLDLSQELDSVGAEYNAFTAKDHTGYYIKLDAEKIELAFDMLSDMLFNSKFEPVEINRERGAIIEEINMYEDNPLMQAASFLEEVVFGRCASLGQNIIGNKKNIQDMSREQMLDYKEQFYSESNMVIGVSGRIKTKEVAGLVKKYFAAKSQTKPKKPQFKACRLIQTRSRAEVKPKETEQAQLCLGFPAYHYNHKDIYALELLNLILGANMSSRLFIEVRERRGLCYFIHSSFNPYEDTGSFIIQAGLDKLRVNQALRVILAELKGFFASGVTSDELVKAKDCIQGKTVLELEDSAEVASWYASQLMFLRKVRAPEEKLKLNQGVRLSDIKRVARDIFKLKKINLALIGPFKDNRCFLRLLKI